MLMNTLENKTAPIVVSATTEANLIKTPFSASLPEQNTDNPDSALQTKTANEGEAQVCDGDLVTHPFPLPETFLFAPPAVSHEGPRSAMFMHSILDAATLDTLEIPKREPVVGSWWNEGGMGFIFGARGLGKTWMSVTLARCIAEGRDCGPWSINKSRRVLYVDGEMALESMRERDRALRQKIDAPLYFLSHEQHFRKTEKGLNLTDPAAQSALLAVIEEYGAEVVFLDNLSCLFSGMRENDADDWESVLPWLLTLRRKGIAVCVVHHSGRNPANMRGTSRREDAAFWIMSLGKPNAADEEGGAQFIGSFTKYREGDQTEKGPWHWTFKTTDGKTSVSHVRIDNLDAFIQLVNDGLDSCTDIAVEMAVSKGAVSKWAKQALALGKIRIVNKCYLPAK